MTIVALYLQVGTVCQFRASQVILLVDRESSTEGLRKLSKVRFERQQVSWEKASFASAVQITTSVIDTKAKYSMHLSFEARKANESWQFSYIEEKALVNCACLSFLHFSTPTNELAALLRFNANEWGRG